MKKATDKEQNALCGERVRMCRIQKGLTLEQLAEKVGELPSNNGRPRSPQHIGYIERGNRPLSLEWAFLLAEALDVRTDYLLCKDDFRTELERTASPYLDRVVAKSFRSDVMEIVLREFGISLDIAAESEFDIDCRDMDAAKFSKLSPKMQKYLVSRHFGVATDGYYSLRYRGEYIGTVTEREKDLFEGDIYDYIELKIQRLLERHRNNETECKG